jgi:hypothetical protein
MKLSHFRGSLQCTNNGALGRGDFSNSFAIRKKLVDVTGIEPVTPCLQIQKPKLDDIKKDGKE